MVYGFGLYFIGRICGGKAIAYVETDGKMGILKTKK